MTQTTAPSQVPTTPPAQECDVVLKGGITSGVVYPAALVEFAASYRLRSLGGASAGGIGSALGAAAEFGRADGGFDKLGALPGQLGDGRLAALFAPQRATRPLLRVMLAATGQNRAGPARQGVARLVVLVLTVLRSYPVAALLGVLPGHAVVVLGVLAGGATGIGLALCGLILGVVGIALAIALRLVRQFGRDVPENLFGICRGLGTPDSPALTDWLSSRIDDLAGLAPGEGPLRFGQLWTGSPTPRLVPPGPERVIDLRMISTCLSQGRPYEMPWEAAGFFFDPQLWRTLFPAEVVQAMLDAPAASQGKSWAWEDEVARAHTPALHRLPPPEHLPVIVATRMTLSFPLLISAVPLWTIDRRRAGHTPAGTADAGTAEAAARRNLVFAEVWFTDGGLCSNFPIHLFDAALPTRPTFAVDLGSFALGQSPDPDQALNIEYATDNNQGLLPGHAPIPATGLGALAAFASAGFATARSWSDETQLSMPGFRDRIVRVLQTRAEGGMNLHLDAATIEQLSERGRAAARALIDQFNQPRYPARQPSATGWENHKWVRHRALLACLPDWLEGYARGRAAQDFPPEPPSYPMTRAVQGLADALTANLDATAAVLEAPGGDPEVQRKALAGLTRQPAPHGVIRRTPAI